MDDDIRDIDNEPFIPHFNSQNTSSKPKDWRLLSTSVERQLQEMNPFNTTINMDKKPKRKVEFRTQMKKYKEYKDTKD